MVRGKREPAQRGAAAVRGRRQTVRRSSPAARPRLAELDDPVLAEMVKRLVDRLAPQQIYLFGSRARGDARPDSDYDLMVLVKERIGEGRHMEREAYDVLSGLGVTKDVVIMTRERFDWLRAAAASLPATVEREGRLLYAA